MKTIAEQHQCWCIHYQRKPGMPKREACKKGVVYDDLARVAELGPIGSALRLPCVRGFDPKGQPVSTCEHMQFPTLEESQAHESEMRQFIERMMVVTKMVAPLRKQHRGKDATGTLKCPICKGTIHWRHAGYNGHMRVCCETKDCVNWIE